MKSGLLVVIISQLALAVCQPALAAVDVSNWDELSRAASREFKNKQYLSAERLYQQAIDACERTDYKRIIDTRINLASVLLDQGRTKEASDVLQTALSDCQKSGRSESAAFLRILRRLDRAWGESNPRSALDMDREAVALSEKLFGTLSPSSIDATERLCVRLEKAGELKESLQRSKSMLQRLKKKGQTSRSTVFIAHLALSARTMIDSLCQQSKFKEAFDLGKNSLATISDANPIETRKYELPVLIRTAAVAMTLCGQSSFQDPEIASDYATLTLHAYKLRGQISIDEDDSLVQLAPPLSDYYDRTHREGRAIALCHYALSIATDNPLVTDDTRAYLKSTMARPLIEKRKLTEAHELLLQSKLRKNTPPMILDNVVESTRKLVEVYLKKNQLSAARQLLDTLQESGTPQLNAALRSMRSELRID